MTLVTEGIVMLCGAILICSVFMYVMLYVFRILEQRDEKRFNEETRERFIK